MMVNCAMCRADVNEGIWRESYFTKKAMLFCSSACKEALIQKKLQRIKVGYPKMYARLTKEYEQRKKEDSKITLSQIAEHEVI